MRKWHKIEYFHPEGKSMPNGINYQRGWFSKECRNNMEAFLPVPEDIIGILVLPSQGGRAANAHSKHLFTGRFVNNGVIFDCASPTIEVKATSTGEARREAERFCGTHSIHTAIMKIFPIRKWCHIFFNGSPCFYLYHDII